MKSRELTRQAGMTLIELLIVVAIIGILASLAVYMFKRVTAKAHASEVPAVFAEFRIRQESYHLENGAYLSTGADETDMYPSAPVSPSEAPTPIDLTAMTGDSWRALRFRSEKNALYCSYVNIAGTPPTDTPGTIANSFGFSGTQPSNWFYMLAECNLDGDSSLNSTYFARSGADGQAVQNDGK